MPSAELAPGRTMTSDGAAPSGGVAPAEGTAATDRATAVARYTVTVRPRPVVRCVLDLGIEASGRCGPRRGRTRTVVSSSTPLCAPGGTRGRVPCARRLPFTRLRAGTTPVESPWE